MTKVLVLYFSRTGHVKKMAEEIAVGVKATGAEASLCDIDECIIENLIDYDGFIIGSPTYYGLAAGPVKDFFDRSIVHHGKLEGKAGGAFSSAGVLGGGSETTVMSIVQMMLVHGMVVQGQAKGHHYGVVAIGEPDEKVIEQCHELGKRVAYLAKKMVD
ncbi:MAG: flavodoxin family protein [Bacillota bacterium]